MPSIQIKHVPDAVHAELRRRAAKHGQSLQEYLLAMLEDAASRRPIDEIFAEIERRGWPGRNTVTADDIVADIRDERDRR